MRKPTKFEKLATKASEICDVPVDFYYGEKGSDVFEDDGTLHVRVSGTRACFGVSAYTNDDGAKQNQRTIAVLKAMGMESKIGDRVLVEECSEDDDDYCCSECGRR